MSPAKCFAYVLRSLADRRRYYTGVTSDPPARLADHRQSRPHPAIPIAAPAARPPRRTGGRQQRREDGRGLKAATSAPLLLRDAIEVFSTAEVEFVADHDWGSVEAVVELVKGQQLELRAARDDGDAAFAPGDVYASGGAYG
jgi:hypothetical protein